MTWEGDYVQEFDCQRPNFRSPKSSMVRILRVLTKRISRSYVLTRDGNDGPWSSFHIHVGTPPQATRVLASTVIGESWVISDNNTQGGCLEKVDSDNCPQSRGGLINVNKSSTWQDQGIFALGVELNLPDYGGQFDNADYGMDSLGLGLPISDGITLNNQVVAALATKDFYLGYLGLTSRPTNFTGFNDPKTSFLSSLKEQDHIPSLSFGYTAGNQYRMLPKLLLPTDF